MADGLNQARAMRIAEIMADYRNIQSYIAAIRASPSAEEYNEEGYAVLRNCVAQAQQLLDMRFATQTSNSGDQEVVKASLRRILADAFIRRFRAQKIYLRAAACLRWVNARSQILQGGRPHAGHAAALTSARNILRTELASITDAWVDSAFRQADAAAGKWLAEDPSLASIQRVVGAQS